MICCGGKSDLDVKPSQPRPGTNQGVPPYDLPSTAHREDSRHRELGFQLKPKRHPGGTTAISFTLRVTPSRNMAASRAQFFIASQPQPHCPWCRRVNFQDDAKLTPSSEPTHRTEEERLDGGGGSSKHTNKPPFNSEFFYIQWAAQRRRPLHHHHPLIE